MRNICSRSLAMAILSIAALTIACSSSTEVEAAPRLKPEKERKPAPEFTLKDSNGATVHLSDYRGKVVLLDFWATWCNPCQVELPWFMEFEQSLKSKGFAVLGVSMDEDGWDVVKPYIQKRKINYRILLGDDHTGQIYGGVDSLPMTFLLDRQGRVAAVHIGLSSDKEGFLNEINELLGARRAGSGAVAGGVTALAGAK